MRPAILTDDVLRSIDLTDELDALERLPTDDGIIRDVYREMWPPTRSRSIDPQVLPWDEWVRLP